MLTGCEQKSEETPSETPSETVTTTSPAFPQLADKPAQDTEVAIIETEAGTFKMCFYPEYAPKAVENFLTHAEQGYYNGITFHRVINDFMIQGGDPKGDGTGGSDTTIKGEFKINGVQNDLSHVAGVISMARKSMPYDSATSQFFICNADASASLDGKYAGFGYVVAGLDVVLTVSEVEVKASASGENSVPVEPVVIEKICFVTKN